MTCSRSHDSQVAGSCPSPLFLVLFWSFLSLQLASYPLPLDTYPLSQITNITDYHWKLLISRRGALPRLRKPHFQKMDISLQCVDLTVGLVVTLSRGLP